MAIRAFRGIQRLSRVLDASRTLNFTLRCTSTSARTKLITGSNGEKIFVPVNDVTYPEILIHEFIWNNIENYPDHIALECGINGKKYTYAQAKDATYYIGRSLRNMGLKEGDVIALAASNSPDTVLGLLGGLSGGFVITSINPYYMVDEMSKQLLKVNAKAIITSASIASTTLAATRASCLPPEIPFIVIDDKTGSIPEGSIPFDDLITRGKSLPLISTNTICDNVAILPFSSGTTGLPKGVMLTHRNVVSNLVMCQNCLNDTYHPTTSTYQEIIPLILPFFHIYGMNVVVLSNLAVGSKLITVPKFVPETFLDVLQKKTTVLYCVPPIILFLSGSSLVKIQHLKHLHTIISGAAPLAKTDIDKLFNKFNIDSNIVKFRQGYGLTESSPVAFAEDGKKFSSIGKNVDGCLARLVNIETRQDVATPGETGELWIKGPHIMKGYFNDEASTKATLTEDKWLKTGDVAYFDEDYDFFITDRMKELIKVKGFQVPPAELEALLRTHPDVNEAAVIGIPHARYGEVPKAFITAKKGKKPTEDDIKNFMKEKVSDYKQLEGGVIFLNEIPKSTTGKILRSKLKSEYQS